MKKTLIFTLILLTLIPFTYAANDFAYNRLYENQQVIDGFDYLINVNHSTTSDFATLAGHSSSTNNWITLSLGTLDDASTIQFNNIGGTLNIDPDYIDDNWCALTGCTMEGDIDMDGNGLTKIQYLDFNLTANVVSQEGRATWNDEDKTLNIGTDINDVTLQVGQESHLRVFNNAGRDFFNGDVVFINGAQGQRPTINLAISSNSSRSRLIGLLTHDCSESSNCIVTTGGIVRDLDTSSFSAGDMLYLSSTQEGNFTKVSPVAPNFPILVGIVLNSNVNEGKVLVSTGPTDVVNDMVIQGLTINTNLTVGDSIFFQDSDHFLRRGALGFDGLATNAFAFQQNIEHPEGTIPFIVTANKTNSDNDAVLIMVQIGLNESNSVLGNSWFVIVNNLTNNLTEYSNCFLVAGLLNETLRVQCDSSDSGADLIVQDDIQSFGTIFADGGIRAETLVDFVMNGEDVNIQGGGLHIFTAVTFEQGVVEGNEVTTFIESFDSGLGSFTNIQDDLGNWFVTSNIFCDDGDCANAIGVSGVGNIIIEANISTVNINSTSLNFIYSLVNMLGANDFEVTVNNNVGSGEVSVFTDATNNVVKSSQSITLPSSMSNQPKVSIRFNCDVTNTNRQCFVDTISVNGTAIATTITNVSGFNSVIKFGDGALAADGFPERGIIYNASGDKIIVRGNVTFENIIEQDLNITNSITLNSSTIFDWAGVVTSPLFPSFFLTNGSSIMTGNINVGGFNLTNALFGFFTNLGSASTRIANFWGIDANFSGILSTDTIDSSSGGDITINNDVDLGSHKLKFGTDTEIYENGPATVIDVPGIFDIKFGGVSIYGWLPETLTPTIANDGLINLGATTSRWKTAFITTLDLGTNTLNDTGWFGNFSVDGNLTVEGFTNDVKINATNDGGNAIINFFTSIGTNVWSSVINFPFPGGNNVTISEHCPIESTFWAEESGTLASTGKFFSYGNGNTLANGPEMICDGYVLAMTMDCEISATALGRVQLALDGVAQGSACQVETTGVALASFADKSCSTITFTAGQQLTPITTTAEAGTQGCTPVWYVRYTP